MRVDLKVTLRVDLKVMCESATLSICYGAVEVINEQTQKIRYFWASLLFVEPWGNKVSEHLKESSF